MVKLLHTSDWHLGRFLYGKSLLEDQEFALDRLVELIDQVKPHGLLIAGDIFDRALPPEAAVTLFDQFLSEVILRRHLPIFLIPGNHDSAERVGFASKLLRDRNLTIYSRPEDALHPSRLVGENGCEVLIYGIPFVEPPVIAQALGRDDISTPNEAVRALCRLMIENHGAESDTLHTLNKNSISLDRIVHPHISLALHEQDTANPIPKLRSKPNAPPAVLLCHAFVTGGESSESEKDLFIGGSSNVDAQAFTGFAYTALGHLHKPQRAGSDVIRYSGSLLPYSKSETNHIKSITEVRIDGSGNVEIELHSLPLLRQLRYCEDQIANILAEAVKDTNRDDYLIVGLTDQGPVLDAFAQIRRVYPNLLHVSRVGGFIASELPSLHRNRELETINDIDLFAQFFHDSTGAELSSEQREVLIETIRELDASEGRSL